MRRLATWLLLLLLALLSSPAAMAGGSTSTECGPFNVPDANTTPSTSPMASGTTIEIDVSACDPSFFGTTGIKTAPLHGTATLENTVTPPYDILKYTNNGDGATTDTLVFGDDAANLVTMTIHIGPPTSPITVTPGSLPAPQVGVAYSETLSASGGTAPYTWSLDNGSLPPGLTLSGNTLSGTPTTDGSFALNIKVSDSASHSTVKGYSLTVPVPSVHITTVLPNPVRGIPYSQQLQSAEGTSPYTYSMDYGNLPAGLTLSPTGLVSGIPTGSATTTFSIESRDSSAGGPYFGPNYFTLTTEAPPSLTLSPTSLPAPQAGVGYNATITASGGVAPYHYAVTSGALPAGLSLNTSTGALSGTPTEGGSFSFTVTATDSNTTGATTGSQAYTFNVAAATIIIAPTTLPSGTTGTAYSQTISAAGGTAPYSYARTAGSLPAGLTLTPMGLLSGNPTTSGTFDFTITATDSSTGGGPYGQTQAYTVTIASAMPIAKPVSAAVAYGSAANPITLDLTGGTATAVAVAGAPAHGTALASGTAITYQPDAGYAGPDSFTYTASNADGTSAPATVSITVSPPTVTLTPATLPGPVLNVPYSQSVSAAGGATPYSYAVTGSLPAGLNLNATTGVISGTPTTTGSYNFTVTATDNSTGSGAPFMAAQSYSGSVSAPTLTLSPATLPAATVGAAVSQVFTTTGGAPSYHYAVSAGALPAGVTLATDGTLSGTPTAGGSFNFTVKATDANGNIGSAAYTWTLNAPTLTVTPASLPAATSGAAYTQTLSASGGIAPYRYAVTTGTLPAGMSLDSTGTLSGTPSAVGDFPIVVEVKDSSTGSGPYLHDQSYTVHVDAPLLTLSPASGNLTANYGQSFTQSFHAGGGVAPYTYDLAGALPYGLSFDAATGTLSGSATQTGSFPVTVTVTDASTGAGAPFSVSHNYTIQVGTPSITLTPTTLTAGTVGTAYSTSISASGGLAPYTYSVTAGALPAGLTLHTDGTLSGTPTAAGSFQITLIATDAHGQTGSSSYSLIIAAPTIALTPATLPVPILHVAYTQSVSASGGTAPYSYAVTAGSLPAGLALNTSTGAVAGTPTTAGAYSFTVTATDSTTGTGAPFTAAHSYSGTVSAPTFTLSPAALPAATVGVAVSQSFGTSGGVGPYTYAISAGALPSGVNLATDGTLSGTPTAGGNFGFTVQATDSNTNTGIQTYHWTVGAPTIAVTPATLPAATVAAAYTQSLSASGGIAPYSYAVTTGALPTGMSLANDGTLSGTPTAAGNFTFTVAATDSSGGAGPYAGNQVYTLHVAAPTLTLDPPGGNLAADYGQSFTQSFHAGGGVAPYTYGLTGALPNGLSFDAATGTLSGSATQTGSFPVTVTVTDASTGAGAPFSVSHNYTIQVGTPSITLTPTTLTAGTVGTAYSTSISASGGLAPYTYSVTAGALPAGLTLHTDGTLSGTPTAAGSFNITLTATDAHGQTGSSSYSLNMAGPTLSLSPGSLPAATAENTYHQTLAASGGTAPYGYAVTTGSLPTGLALNASTGVLSGTPTVDGSFTFSVTATDSTTGASAPFTLSHSYTLKVDTVVITVTPTHLSAMQAGKAFSQQLGASGGDGHYAYSVTSGALPPGVSLSAAGLLAGTATAAGHFDFTVSAKDGFGFTGAQAYSLSVGQPVPVAKDDSASTKANQAATIKVTANDSGPFTSVAVADKPGYGSTRIHGLDVVYTPASNYYGNDSFTYTVTGPGGTSAPATVTIHVAPLAVPVAKAQKATVLAGKSVTFDTTRGATGGPFTKAAITTAPRVGTAIVKGTDITYNAPADAAGSVTLDYTLANAFGASRAVRITITVHPRPVAPALTAKVLAGSTVHLKVTDNAQGGPFTGAKIVSIQPSAAGTASVKASDGGYVLDFRAAGDFSGQTQLTYTLSNAYATSAPGTIRISVMARPDPSKDPEVLGILAAQANATRRLARGQINNFQQRLQSLHDGSANRAGFSNGLRLNEVQAFRPLQRDQRYPLNPGEQRSGPSADWSRSYLGRQPARMTTARSKRNGRRHPLPGGLSVWTGGAVNFGRSTPGTDVGGLDFTTAGITIGADQRIGKTFTMGAGIGYGHDLTDVGHNGSRSTADSYNAAVYASYHPNKTTYVDGLVGYQWLSFQSHRYLTANGGRVYGKRDGKQWFGSLSVGYMHRAKSLLLTPYARLDMAHARLDAYTERGDALYALSYGKQSVDTTTGSLGLRMQWSVKRDYGIWMPSLKLEYRHDFQGASTVALRYADLLQGPVYRADVPELSHNHALLGVGIGLQTLNGWTSRFAYRNLLDNTTHGNQSILLHVEKSFPP